MYVLHLDLLLTTTVLLLAICNMLKGVSEIFMNIHGGTNKFAEVELFWKFTAFSQACGHF